MASKHTFKLSSGYEIPAIGLGTWLSKPNEVEKAVELALRIGYRHIDAAAIYGNEAEVGRGIKASGVPRNEIFITSKLWNTDHAPEDVEPAIDQTLKDLQTDYVDLYLIHWPVSFLHTEKPSIPADPVTGLIQVIDVPIADTWKALESLVTKGKARSIGVSNFTQAKIEELLKTASIPPAVNQVEAHPYLQQRELFEFAKKNNILIEGYSPLGNNIYNLPMAIDDDAVKAIAKDLGKTPAQVLISWAVQRGTVSLPKSVTEERIKSNFQDFELPEDVFNKISALEKHGRYNFPKRWGVDIFGEVGEKSVKQSALEWAAEQKKLAGKS